MYMHSSSSITSCELQQHSSKNTSSLTVSQTLKKVTYLIFSTKKMDVSSSPPGVHRVKAAPPGNIKSGLKAPPGNIKRREEKKEERKSTTTCKGVIHLKLDRAFEEGTQSREYYEWETSLRNKIANSLGLSPETIIITGVEKGDLEHEELNKVQNLRLDRTTTRHELSMKHLKKMENIFNRLNPDAKGQVSCRSFIQALKKDPEVATFLHLPLRSDPRSSDHSFAERFDLMDVDGKKQLDFENFVAFFGMSDESYLLNKATFTKYHDSIRVKHMSPEQEQSVRRLFLKFDPTYSGYISKEEFLRKYHHKLPLWSLIDENGDNFITSNEFVSYFDDLHGGTMSDAAFYKHLILFQ